MVQLFYFRPVAKLGVAHYDFWVGGKPYRGSIPEARVKAQAERAENAIRDQVYEGRYGKKKAIAPLLRDFVSNTFLPWSRANKRTRREDVYRFPKHNSFLWEASVGRNLVVSNREVQDEATANAD